jgi:hypothetical protein
MYLRPNLGRAAQVTDSGWICNHSGRKTHLKQGHKKVIGLGTAFQRHGAMGQIHNDLAAQRRKGRFNAGFAMTAIHIWNGKFCHGCLL